MTEAQYGLNEDRNLLRVPHRNSVLTVRYPAFGQRGYLSNIIDMEYAYGRHLPKHLVEPTRKVFRELTISESLSAAAYEFEILAKPEIFDPAFLQAGRILKTQDGIWVNPRNSEGDFLNDKITPELLKEEELLKRSLKTARKIPVGAGHIYLCDKDIGFAEYETFQMDIQDQDTFVQGGLAKILEHTPNEAGTLKSIASLKNYSNGVRVEVFNPKNRELPELKCFTIGSGKYDDLGRLTVFGWMEINPLSWTEGYAFGKL